MHLGAREGSILIQKELRTLDGHLRIKMSYLTLLTFQMFLTKETATAVKQRSHPLQLRSAKIQGISLNEISIGEFTTK